MLIMLKYRFAYRTKGGDFFIQLYLGTIMELLMVSEVIELKLKMEGMPVSIMFNKLIYFHGKNRFINKQIYFRKGVLKTGLHKNA